MRWKLPFKYAKSYPHWPELRTTTFDDYWDSQEKFNVAWRIWYYGHRR